MLLRLIVLLVLAVTLTACGFHLRGSYSDAGMPLYVSSKQHGNVLLYQMRETLDRASRLSSSKSDSLHLVLLRSRLRSQLVSISGTTRSRLYRYRVDFKLLNRQKDLISPASVIVERVNYTSDINHEGNQISLEIMQQEMMDEAINRIIAQVDLRYGASQQ